MKILKLRTVATLSALLISSIANVANADVILDQSYVPPDFNDVVQTVYDTGLVLFENNGHYRLWGIIPDVPYLRQLVVGKTLRCLQAGETHRRYLGVSDVRSSVRVVYCHQGLPGPYPEGNLTEHLLATGHAIEICPETGNLFGTCNK